MSSEGLSWLELFVLEPVFEHLFESVKNNPELSLKDLVLMLFNATVFYNFSPVS